MFKSIIAVGVLTALAAALWVVMGWVIERIASARWWRRNGYYMIQSAERGCAWILIVVSVFTMLAFIVWGAVNE